MTAPDFRLDPALVRRRAGIQPRFEIFETLDDLGKAVLRQHDRGISR